MQVKLVENWDAMVQQFLNKLKEWSVPTRKRCNAFYYINSKYFNEIDNEHKAYWLGFLLADGHVNDKGIMMALKKDDIQVIVDFLKDIDSDAKIRNDSHANHFIRGMFDGDGSIRYYKYGYQKSPQYHFGYTGLKEICEYIKKKLNLTRDLIKEGTYTYTAITRNPKVINNIAIYLYKDATIYMKRKYNTFNEIKIMTFNDYNSGIHKIG